MHAGYAAIRRCMCKNVAARSPGSVASNGCAVDVGHCWCRDATDWAGESDVSVMHGLHKNVFVSHFRLSAMLQLEWKQPFEMASYCSGDYRVAAVFRQASTVV